MMTQSRRKSSQLNGRDGSCGIHAGECRRGGRRCFRVEGWDWLRRTAAFFPVSSDASSSLFASPHANAHYQIYAPFSARTNLGSVKQERSLCFERWDVMSDSDEWDGTGWNCYGIRRANAFQRTFDLC
mmetsp:Transcript_64403/g.77361  ORF Transcript_64403/g.77361 Transcript_64403/m.77361 type:complete len:128 (-) Transcript_64403:81-464(-)